MIDLEHEHRHLIGWRYNPLARCIKKYKQCNQSDTAELQSSISLDLRTIKWTQINWTYFILFLFVILNSIRLSELQDGIECGQFRGEISRHSEQCHQYRGQHRTAASSSSTPYRRRHTCHRKWQHCGVPWWAKHHVTGMWSNSSSLSA